MHVHYILNQEKSSKSILQLFKKYANTTQMPPLFHLCHKINFFDNATFIIKYSLNNYFHYTKTLVSIVTSLADNGHIKKEKKNQNMSIFVAAFSLKNI